MSKENLDGFGGGLRNAVDKWSSEKYVVGVGGISNNTSRVQSVGCGKPLLKELVSGENAALSIWYEINSGEDSEGAFTEAEERGARADLNGSMLWVVVLE